MMVLLLVELVQKGTDVQEMQTRLDVMQANIPTPELILVQYVYNRLNLLNTMVKLYKYSLMWLL